VILHVGDPKEYAASHIPGARFAAMGDVSVSDHSDPNALMLEMPLTDTLRAHLAALGISDDSRIVIYYAKDWVSPSTRIIFTLDYAGLGANASLLDGGMGAWIKEGRPVTDAVPAARTGRLAPLRTRRIIVDAEYVRAHIARPGVSIVDGRNSGFYDGVQTGRGMTAPQRTGHIASAKSVPFNEVTNDALGVRSNAELEALFTKAGVAPGDTVVGYCHIGQQTTAMLFAARLLGHPVLLYDGSFEDWSRHVDYPVENPSEKKKKP
jgi:thiosulfate/3-mercaptopyruvate sulfurtransferase